MNIKETYFGFTNNKKPMQAARIEKTLDKLIGHEGKVITQKEFIYNKLLEGYTVDFEENYSYYSPKIDGMTKPKTLYKLIAEDRSYFEITKTEYDFALHIIDNGFLTTEKAAQFIITEQEQKAEVERLQREKEEQERKEHAEQEARGKAERDARRQEKLSEWQAIGEQLVSDEIKNVITEVIERHWEQLESRVSQSKQELINSMINKLPQFLGNYEYMKSHVNYLLSDDINKEVLSQIVNKEIYMSIFNITEEDKPQTITAKIKAFYEGRKYKGGTSKPVITETFYIYTRDKGFIEVEGQRKMIEGYTCFIHKNENGFWAVTEAQTGAAICNGSSKSEAIDKAKNSIIKHTEKLNNLIKSLIEQNGISPLYNNQVTA